MNQIHYITLFSTLTQTPSIICAKLLLLEKGPTKALITCKMCDLLPTIKRS